MTEETRKLFNAPWRALPTTARSWAVYNSDGSRNIDYLSKPDANRLARLPELYDALADATRHLCKDIRNNREPDCEKCFYGKLCAVRSWIELMRKVRDGE